MPSLSVTALRLAAVETLAPTGAVTWPTIAGARVYDSRAVAFDDMSGASQAPAIGVYTEETLGERRGPAAPSHPAWLSIDLVLEIEMAVIDRQDGVESIGNPVTDPQAELQLDFLAAQIRHLLLVSPKGALFRSVSKAVERVRVTPFRLTDLQLRLARRTMVLTCSVDDDEWSDAAELPEPMKSLAAKLPAGGYAKSTIDLIASAIAATTRDPLAEIRLGFNVDKNVAPPTTAAADTEARGDV